MPLPTPWASIHFDPAPKGGSREHYFHFLLGYLLPGIHAAYQSGHVDGLVFESCGHVMDKRLEDACAMLGIGCTIEQRCDDKPSDQDRFRHLLAPRWDHWLMRGRPDERSFRQRVADSVARALPGSVPSNIRNVCRRLIRAAEPSAKTPLGDEWLLIRRAPEPDFYSPGGMAEIPSYGAGRRAIANLDALAHDLVQHGLSIRVYEPGADSLASQIQAFRGARGVIAIRGAELANLVWMRRGRRVVMLATPMRSETHAAWNLAVAMGLSFTQLPVDCDYPEVSAERVLEALASRPHCS